MIPSRKLPTIRVNDKLLGDYIVPLLEKHKKFVKEIYPNSYFLFGYIYSSDPYKQLTTSRFAISGIEAEYYAWLWASEKLKEELLERLSE